MKIIAIIILSVLAFSCDLSSTHDVRVQVNSYHCYECDNTWNSNPMAYECPKCESPRIEIVSITLESW